MRENGPEKEKEISNSQEEENDEMRETCLLNHVLCSAGMERRVFTV